MIEVRTDSVPGSRGERRAEADLYPPLKRALDGLGYAVKGEIEGCDVVALRHEFATRPGGSPAAPAYCRPTSLSPLAEGSVQTLPPLRGPSAS